MAVGGRKREKERERHGCDRYCLVLVVVSKTIP
jgi:hypothetical protein